MLAVYVALQVVPLLRPAGDGAPLATASHANDYKHIWLGSVMLGEGLSPYSDEQFFTLMSDQSQRDPRFGSINPYVYLPFTGFALRPLTLLEFATSVAAFQVVNHLCMLGGVALLLWGVGRLDWNWFALAIAILAVNNAVFRQNNAGQLNAVLFFGMSVLFAGYMKQWPAWIIGFVAAFLMLFKLSPGIFLIWFLLRREWRYAGWMVAWALILTGVTIGFYGMETHLDFLPVLANMGYGKSTWAEYGATFWRDPYNISFNGLFHRILVVGEKSPIQPWFRLSAGIANGLTWIASLVVLGAFGFVTIFKSRNPATESTPDPCIVPLAFSMAVVTSLLLPSIFWDHYLTQAVLPVVLLLIVGSPVSKCVAIASAILMAIPMALGDAFYQSGLGLLLMNFKLLIPVAIFGVCAWELCRTHDTTDHRAGLPTS